MHIYIYTYVHINIDTHIHMYMYVCIYVFICICRSVCAHIGPSWLRRHDGADHGGPNAAYPSLRPCAARGEAAGTSGGPELT